MPKQIIEINPFHGGLNNNGDPRDIKVEELDNQINLNIVFSLKRAPNSLESVQVTFKQ